MRAGVITAVAAVLVGICTAEGAIVELALPCAGRYDWQTPSCTVDFDLGVQFSEISHVYLEWSGEIMAGLGTDPYVPGPQPFPTYTGFDAWLFVDGGSPYRRRATVSGGPATYPEAEAFEVLSEFVKWGGATWNDLLDGQGTVVIGMAALGTGGGQILDRGFVELDSVVLLVDGTIVPEPVSLVYGVLTGLLLLKRRGCGNE